MKTYRIKIIQEYLESYDIEANSVDEAVQKLYDLGDIQPDDTKVGESKVKDVFQLLPWTLIESLVEKLFTLSKK